MKRYSLCLAALLGFSSLTFANTLLFDFGTEVTGTASLGGTWNELQTDTASGLLFSDGTAATGIGVDLTNASTSTTNQGLWGGGGDKSWVDEEVTRDYIWNGSEFTITLTGLNDAVAYDLSLVAVRNGGSNRIGTYTVQGLTTTDEVSSSSYNAATAFTNQTILNWTAVNPTAGEIVITATPDSGDTVFVNALQVVAIPEPGTLGLVLLSACTLGVFRLRRRN